MGRTKHLSPDDLAALEARNGRSPRRASPWRRRARALLVAARRRGHRGDSRAGDGDAGGGRCAATASRRQCQREEAEQPKGGGGHGILYGGRGRGTPRGAFRAAESEAAGGGDQESGHVRRRRVRRAHSRVHATALRAARLKRQASGRTRSLRGSKTAPDQRRHEGSTRLKRSNCRKVGAASATGGGGRAARWCCPGAYGHKR